MQPDALLPGEQAVLEALPDGKLVDLPQNEQGRAIRADVLVRILAGDIEGPAGKRPALRLAGAHVTGELHLEGIEITFPLHFEQCLFESGICISDADVTTIRMPGCQTTGFDGRNLRTRGDVELNEGFICSGRVDLTGARIGGSLSLARGLFHNPTSEAIRLSRAVIEGALLGRESLTCGQIRMISTRIGGLLSLAGGVIDNPGRVALHAERAEIGESIFFQEGFKCFGRVLLQHARIGGGVDARRSIFDKPDTCCINLVRAQVERNVSLVAAQVNGSLRLGGAAIGGSLLCKGTAFTGTSTEIVLDDATMQRAKFNFGMAPKTLSMRHANIKVIEDNPASWPDNIALDGCVYEAIYPEAPITVAHRIEWLQKGSSGYHPQPYEQLMAVYKVLGEEQHAHRVGLEKQRRRRRTIPWPSRILGYLLDGSVGYGYRTWLAAIWLAFFLAVGTFLFTVFPARMIGEGTAPKLQPFVLTLDLLLPIVDLGQEKSWEAAEPVRWLGWALVLLGWTLTTAVVAGLTKLFNRN